MSMAWKAIYAADPARWRARSAAWDKANPEKKKLAQKKADIKGKYGLDYVTYEKMVADQAGKCAICGDETRLEVDHDHATGKVRGLLCTCCNRALGLMKESILAFQAAIAYKQKHG